MADPVSHAPFPADGIETAGATAADTALEQPNDLPFFDLDIGLIRRGQRIAVPQAAMPQTMLPVQAAPLAPIRPAVERTALPSREQQALAALASLVGGRPAPAPVARLQPLKPVQAAPVPAPIQALAAEAVLQPAHYVEARLMPAAPAVEPDAAFVQPAFERLPDLETENQPAPATSQPDTTSLITNGLRTAAEQVAAQANDWTLDVRFGRLQAVLAVREEKLTVRAAKPSAPVDAPAAAPAKAEPQAQADDLPWGHVTYRLLVM